MDESKGSKLEEKLVKKELNVWEQVDKKTKSEIMDLSEEYKKFLNIAKTERESVSYIIEKAEEAGFKSFDELAANNKLKAGSKFYFNNRGKMAIVGILGKKSLKEGVKIVGAHVDAPRLDFKPNPFYENEHLCLAKTHYYGGIKKYHWAAMPLAIHGVIINSKGETINISIGENDEDPVFTITDLLPHLAKDQMKKTMGEGISGEKLNLLLGCIPYEDEEVKEKIKLTVLEYLYDIYGLVEEDFISAEIEIVPAGKSRDIGFDRGLIGAYGQDDRICAFTALQAILEAKDVGCTAIAYFTDKEEIGSSGNTGALSNYLQYALAKLCNNQEIQGGEPVYEVLSNSKALSADVSVAIDPNYEGVLDKYNAARLSQGIVITKYTGSRGKNDANDAHAEYIGYVRNLFNNNNVMWQTGELGKVDQGGGGTIAQYLANIGIETIDCGPAILGMHSPFEVSSKADVYMSYKAYKIFFMDK